MTPEKACSDTEMFPHHKQGLNLGPRAPEASAQPMSYPDASVIPANDTRESVFGHRKFPHHKQGLNLGPLAPEASAQPVSYPDAFCS